MSTVSVFAGEDALPAPNDPLVSTDDFSEWFSIDAPTASELARMQTAIEIASAECRSETQQQLTVISETITIHPRPNTCEIILPQWPVTAVDSIIINGTQLTADTDYFWERTGIIRFLTYQLLTPRYPLTVRYTHGWDPLPRDLAGVCLSLSKRLYDSPDAQHVEKEALGDWSVTYTSKTDGLTTGEVETLKRYASWTNGY